jgi:hypothetical protein
VCRADQCIGSSPEFEDSPVPAGNCGPVSSGVHMLDRHVHILYNFMFYRYLRGKRKRRYSDSAGKKSPDPRFNREEEKEIFGFSM